MEFGKFTPKEALKKAGQLTLLAATLNFSPLANAQSLDSNTVMVDCGNKTAVLTIDTVGIDRLSVTDETSKQTVDLTPQLEGGNESTVNQFTFEGLILGGANPRFTPINEMDRIDLYQNRNYRIDSRVGAPVSRIAITLSCLP